jgi:xanthine dehydrogenase YagS FAD-binding subunit
MPPIRDVMPAFELFQPASVNDALGILDRHGADAWVMAGGMDTFDWLKDRIRKPRVVIDLGMVNELRGIKDNAGGVEIGAMTTLTTIANDPMVKERFPMLAEAALIVASPQIRNQGTLGGNVAQDARCWYYRAGWPCYRAGGNICYADTPQAVNREHAIFNADRCVAVNPSDTAPALIALDAQFVIKRGSEERVVPAEEFFIGPGIDIMRLTILQPGDLLTAIRLPATWAGKGQYRRGEQRLGLVDQRRADGDQRRGGDAVSADRGGIVHPRQVARQSDGGSGSRTRGAGCSTAPAQRLQDSAGQGARQARHSWRR